jgi:hypothetical protein
MDTSEPLTNPMPAPSQNEPEVIVIDDDSPVASPVPQSSMQQRRTSDRNSRVHERPESIRQSLNSTNQRLVLNQRPLPNLNASGPNSTERRQSSNLRISTENLDGQNLMQSPVRQRPIQSPVRQRPAQQSPVRQRSMQSIAEILAQNDDDDIMEIPIQRPTYSSTFHNQQHRPTQHFAQTRQVPIQRPPQNFASYQPQRPVQNEIRQHFAQGQLREVPAQHGVRENPIYQRPVQNNARQLQSEQRPAQNHARQVPAPRIDYQPVPNVHSQNPAPRAPPAQRQQ